MNIKINYYILSLTQTFTLIILLTTSLPAVDGGAGLGALMVLVGLIGLLVISIVFRLFIKKNILIYLPLSFIALFFFSGIINGKKDRFKIKSWHMFQTANIHGSYEGNQTINGTENLNIIYMVNSSSQSPDLLDDNKTIYMYMFQKEEIKHKIYVNELDKLTYFKNDEMGKIFMFEDKKENHTSKVTYKAIRDSREYVHDILDYVYDQEATTNYSDKYNRYLTSYEKVEFNDTKKLEKTFFERDPIVLIDKKNKQLRLFKIDNREQFRPFPVPYTPKMALYTHYGDKIYVVYEEIKGVYVLRNINTKAYNNMQNVVKQLIDISLKSPEKLALLKIHTLNTQQLKQLRDVLIKQPNIRYKYKINVIKDKASINITSDSYPLLDITFILNKSSQWRVNNIHYSSQKRLNVLGSL